MFSNRFTLSITSRFISAQLHLENQVGPFVTRWLRTQLGESNRITKNQEMITFVISKFNSSRQYFNTLLGGQHPIEIQRGEIQNVIWDGKRFFYRSITASSAIADFIGGELGTSLGHKEKALSGRLFSNDRTGRLTKGLIIYCPGNSHSATDLDRNSRNVVAEIVAEGYDVYVHERPFLGQRSEHGTSKKDYKILGGIDPLGHLAYVSITVAELHAVSNAMKRNYEQIRVVGQSHGGLEACMLALTTKSVNEVLAIKPAMDMSEHIGRIIRGKNKPSYAGDKATIRQKKLKWDDSQKILRLASPLYLAADEQQLQTDLTVIRTLADGICPDTLNQKFIQLTNAKQRCLALGHATSTVFNVSLIKEWLLPVTESKRLVSRLMNLFLVDNNT